MIKKKNKEQLNNKENTIVDFKHDYKSIKYIIHNLKDDIHKLQNKYLNVQQSMKKIQNIEAKIKYVLELAYQSENSVLDIDEKKSLYKQINNILEFLTNNEKNIEINVPCTKHLNSFGEIVSININDLGLKEISNINIDNEKNCKKSIVFMEKTLRLINQEKYKINAFYKYLNKELEVIINKFDSISLIKNKDEIINPTDLINELINTFDYFYTNANSSHKLVSENAVNLLK